MTESPQCADCPKLERARGGALALLSGRSPHVAAAIAALHHTGECCVDRRHRLAAEKEAARAARFDAPPGSSRQVRRRIARKGNE